MATRRKNKRAPERPPEALREELGAFASRWQHRRNADRGAIDVEDILWAIESAYADGDRWLATFAAQARTYLKKRNRGPRTEVDERNFLLALTARDLASNQTPADMAERFLRRLQALPRVRHDAVVPFTGASDGEKMAHESAVRAVERAFERGGDAENLVRAGLRALGHSKAKNVFAHKNAEAKRVANSKR